MARKNSKKSRYVPIPQESSKVRVVSTKLVYETPTFYVTAQKVVEPSGKTVQRNVVRHPGSVVIMALEETGKQPRVLLVKQYRYAAGRYTWELPAGHIDEGETTLHAAQRELGEETGYTANEWKLALHYYPSPGFMDETMSVYLARDIKKGKANPEDDEDITAKLFPIEAVVKKIMSGDVIDGKTISGVLWLAQKLKK